VQRDIFGGPIDRHTMTGPTSMSHDPVVQRLEALQEAGHAVFPAKLQDKITGVKLTPEQYDALQRTAGMMTKMRLDAMIGTGGFAQLPEQLQTTMIKEAITSSREAARTLTKMQNPDIIRQAMDAKRALLPGPKK